MSFWAADRKAAKPLLIPTAKFIVALAAKVAKKHPNQNVALERSCKDIGRGDPLQMT